MSITKKHKIARLAVAIFICAICVPVLAQQINNPTTQEGVMPNLPAANLRAVHCSARRVVV